MNVDTLPRTLLVAALVALVCSALVAASVTYLRPIQAAQSQLDRNRSILAAAGFDAGNSVSDREVISRFLDLEARVIDLQAGTPVDVADAHSFDHWQTSAPAQDADAEPSARMNRVPAYLVRDGERLQRIVLPVHGPGMWSTLRGYIALEPDLNTIARLVILSHGETPGIGDRIENPAWLASWQGKQLYGADGTAILKVTRNASGPHEVDLITGASVTSEALGTAVQQWFDASGYKPLLERLREQETD